MNDSTMCAGCGAALRQGARFCPGCGAPAGIPATTAAAAPGPAICPQCAAPLKPGAAFCAGCGSRVGAPAAAQAAASTPPGAAPTRTSPPSQPTTPAPAPAGTSTSLDLSRIDWAAAGRTAGIGLAPFVVTGLIMAILGSSLQEQLPYGLRGSLVGDLTAGFVWPLSGVFGFEAVGSGIEDVLLTGRPLLVVFVAFGLLAWQFRGSFGATPQWRTALEQLGAVTAIGGAATLVIGFVARSLQSHSGGDLVRYQVPLAAALFFLIVITAAAWLVAILMRADGFGERVRRTRDVLAPSAQTAMVVVGLASVGALVASVLWRLLDGKNTTGLLMLDSDTPLLVALGFAVLMAVNNGLGLVSFGTFGGSQFAVDGQAFDVSILSGSFDVPGDSGSLPVVLWLIPVVAMVLLVVGGSLMSLRFGHSPRNVPQLSVYAGAWAVVGVLGYPLAAHVVGFREIPESFFSFSYQALEFLPVAPLAIITLPLFAGGLWFLSDWLLGQAAPATRVSLIKWAQRYPWPVRD